LVSFNVNDLVDCLAVEDLGVCSEAIDLDICITVVTLINLLSDAIEVFLATLVLS
jgi:hypothetical protein